mmetsp:Transcript_23491/g.50901  ORF Transcript_23491/g.50901 Transcript_23491/m.50901 type:complete len:239 (-) Transcript_23491:1140-1856(-)
MLHLKVFIATVLVATASSHPFNTSSAASAINAFYKNNRFKGAFLTCSIKGCTADLIAQYIAAAKEKRNEDANEIKSKDNALSRLNPLKKTRGGDLAVVEKKKFSVDLRRSVMFLIYGGFYQGCAQEFIFNDILPYLGKGTDMKTVAKKVAVDMAFISPLICIPMAYLVKGVLLGNSVLESYANYWDDVVNKGVLFKNWMIFMPVQCLTFSVIPEHFRVSFVACVSFFWMIMLSCILSS